MQKPGRSKKERWSKWGARACALCVMVFTQDLYLPCLAQSPPIPESAPGAARVVGVANIEDKNWRFIYNPKPLFPARLRQHPFLHGPFDPLRLMYLSEYVVLFYPKSAEEKPSAVLLSHGARASETIPIEASNIEPLVAPEISQSDMLCSWPTGAGFHKILRRLSGNSIAVDTLDAQKKSLSSKTLHFPQSDERALACGEFLEKAKLRVVVSYDDTGRILRFYLINADPDLRYSGNIEVARAIVPGLSAKGRFIDPRFPSLLLQSRAGNTLWLLTQRAEETAQKRIILDAVALPETEPLVGDLNADGIDELLYLEKDSLRIVQFSAGDVQSRKIVLATNSGQGAKAFTAHFYWKQRRKTSLLLADATLNQWEVWEFDEQFEPNRVATMSAAEVPAPREAFISSIGYATSAIVVYNPNGGWAVSSFGAVTRLLGVRAMLDERLALTDTYGVYFFSDVSPGSYELQFSSPGYTFDPKRASITVEANQTLHVHTIAAAPPYARRNQPGICVGYNDRFHNWGVRTINRYLVAPCAEHSATLSAGDNSKLYELQCCPLPADDILTRDFVTTDGQCPNGYVAAGFQQMDEMSTSKVFTLLCKKVNDARYQLGPATAGAYWGVGESFRGEQATVRFENIPAAFRYSLGRTSHRKWDIDGCLGKPAGSILTRFDEKDCSAMEFRQLQYKGRAGDPPAGTPVQMFPKCRSISSAFSPNPECIK